MGFEIFKNTWLLSNTLKCFVLFGFGCKTVLLRKPEERVKIASQVVQTLPVLSLVLHVYFIVLKMLLYIIVRNNFFFCYMSRAGRFKNYMLKTSICQAEMLSIESHKTKRQYIKIYFFLFYVYHEVLFLFEIWKEV